MSLGRRSRGQAWAVTPASIHLFLPALHQGKYPILIVYNTFNKKGNPFKF